MGLQVWLPFNGNTNNLGLSVDTITSSDITYADSGKIGNSSLNNGSLITTKNHLGYEGTIAFWIFINENGSCQRLYGNNNTNSSSTNRKWSLFVYPTRNSLHSWGCMKDNSSGTNGDWVISDVLPDNKWTHVCISHDRNNQYIYINGSLVKTVAWDSSGTFTFEVSTQLITGLSGHKINDYRLYDHCLSVKEVKEIAKGLVCHYPLKSQYDTGQVNKYSGDIAEGSLGAPVFTKTKLENERGYNYKLSYTGSGGDAWHTIYANNFSFTPGKKYYYSCKVRCRSTNFNLYFRASRSNNDWVTNMTSVLNPDGKWHEYVVYQTINETYVRAGENVTCNPILEFFTESLYSSGKVYSADFDIKDVQVVESDCYVPFIDNSMSSNIISDCSGYGNDGVRNGTIIWSNNSPRYSGSYFFSKSASRYIYRDTRFGFLKNLTFSCWINQMDRATVHGTGEIGLQFVMSQGRDYRENSNLSYGFNIIIASGYMYIISLNTYINTGYLLDLNKWYHICQTFDGSYIRLYVNGECIYTTADNTTDLWNNDGNAFVIGKMSAGYTNDKYYFPFVGKISDVRVYATALSADDIKSLYNTPASLSKNGTLLAYEFNEEE